MFDGHYHGINTGRGYHQSSSIRGPGYHRGQSIRGSRYHRGIVTRETAYHYRGTNLHNDRSHSPNNIVITHLQVYNNLVFVIQILIINIKVTNL